MGKVTIQDFTTKIPISMIGIEAGVCYGSDISPADKNYKRGLECIETNHGRTLEFPDIYMVLEGYSAKVIREFYTHIGGAPTRLQASTRYIDYSKDEHFKFITPDAISKDPAAEEIYLKTMDLIKDAVKGLRSLGIKKEDATMLLPLGMETKIVCKMNLRTLIAMSRQRLCTRAFWEFRDLFNDIMKALSDYSIGWETIINLTCYPKCKELGYCPEKNGCGRFPGKEAP